MDKALALNVTDMGSNSSIVPHGPEPARSKPYTLLLCRYKNNLPLPKPKTTYTGWIISIAVRAFFLHV